MHDLPNLKLDGLVGALLTWTAGRSTEKMASVLNAGGQSGNIGQLRPLIRISGSRRCTDNESHDRGHHLLSGELAYVGYLATIRQTW